MKTLKDFIIEARKPNTPYVKPHMQDGKQVGWKSSNKWGKVKYWQPFAKESAMKHAGVTEGMTTTKGDTTEAGTRHEYRTTHVHFNGKHVANIKTYKGRSGGWISQTEHPDGSSAHKKYGIDLFDNKTDMLKKIRNYHKQQKEDTSEICEQTPVGTKIGTVNGYHIHDTGRDGKNRFLAYANHYSWISHSGATKKGSSC